MLMRISFGTLRMCRRADEPPVVSGRGYSEDMLKSTLLLLDCLGKEGWLVDGIKVIESLKGDGE